MPKVVRLFVVEGCHMCPHKEERRTPGAGFALDYWCTAVKPAKKFDGYIEWPSEMRKPGDFPAFCPLRVETTP
jgi:hypothetical protein